MDTDQIFQMPETQETPSRFRNTIGKYVIRRNARCISCGLCAELCPYGVHPRYAFFSEALRPIEHKCIGFKCQKNDFFCVDRCPEQALTLRKNPLLETLGDYRWTPEMLIGHWEMAETGNLPIVDLEYNLGNSGGGFDKIRFKHPEPDSRLDIQDEAIDTSIVLNKRDDGRPERIISMPCYGGGMSYGSTALSVMVGRARAAQKLNTLTCTGEGGYPLELLPFKNHVITQVATGLFGVREETIQCAPVIEFKYAQGAKPGRQNSMWGKCSSSNSTYTVLSRSSPAPKKNGTSREWAVRK